MQPGSVQKGVVSFVTTVAGTVSSFDPTSFTRRLATAIGVHPSTIALIVAPASVRVSATVQTDSAAEAVQAASAVNALRADVAAATAALGVQIMAIDEPIVTTDVLLAPSPPPPSPLGPSPPQAPPSPPMVGPASGLTVATTFMGLDAATASTVAVALVGGLICAMVLGLLSVLRRRRLLRKQSRLVLDTLGQAIGERRPSSAPPTARSNGSSEAASHAGDKTAQGPTHGVPVHTPSTGLPSPHRWPHPELYSSPYQMPLPYDHQSLTTGASPYMTHGGPAYGGFAPPLPLMLGNSPASQITPLAEGMNSPAAGHEAPQPTSPTGDGPTETSASSDASPPQRTSSAAINFDLPTAGSPNVYAPPHRGSVGNMMLRPAHYGPPDPSHHYYHPGGPGGYPQHGGASTSGDTMSSHTPAGAAASMARASAASAEVHILQMRLAAMQQQLIHPHLLPPPVPPPAYYSPFMHPYQQTPYARQPLHSPSSSSVGSAPPHFMYMRPALSAAHRSQRFEEIRADEQDARHDTDRGEPLPAAVPLPPPSSALLQAADAQFQAAAQIVSAQGTGTAAGPALLVENAQPSSRTTPKQPRSVVRV